MSLLAFAALDDIPAIMAIERRPGYDDLVGRWSAEEHHAEMTGVPGTRYLVARGERRMLGFVILQGLDSANRCTTLRRIAVGEPSRGIGARILAATTDHVFTETPTHRLQLLVYDDNARAAQAYARAGFRTEGLVRDVRALPDGHFRSMYLMSILRPDWAAGQPNRSTE
ncbi:MAG TPA: GNAT family protein [Lichenihabitans sp.]|jgi:RimJ/RimL family protein N-acetyltransferase|nr:GNAT family protein [Lichenihabitans sp.]